jgi:DNA-binding protein H-NS
VENASSALHKLQDDKREREADAEDAANLVKAGTETLLESLTTALELFFGDEMSRAGPRRPRRPAHSPRRRPTLSTITWRS